MSIHRTAAKRDSNERPIIDALEGVGSYVLQLSGGDIPDLAIFFRGRWFMAEVKTRKGRIREGQHWNDRLGEDAVILARTEEDALRGIGAIS